MGERHPLGSVAQIWCYPVKSLAPRSLECVHVGAGGLDGDRRSALFVASQDHARAGKEYRGKEHHLLHTIANVGRARDVAAERHVDLELHEEGPYFDAAAVSIVTDRWVAELETLVGEPLDPLRFRPNFFVRTNPSFAAREEELVGAILTNGEIELEVVAPIRRCVTITYDVATGRADPRIHRTLVEERDNIMGVYCTPRVTGTIARNQTLWIRSGPGGSGGR